MLLSAIRNRHPQGPASAVALTGRLDYFGRTVNIASRIQNLAGADEIHVSDQVFGASGVAEQLQPLAPDFRLAALRGINDELRVLFVSAGPAEAPAAA